MLKDGSFVRNFPLDVGTVVGYKGRRNQDEMFYQFSSFLTPSIIYRYDFTNPDPKPEVCKLTKRLSFPVALTPMLNFQRVISVDDNMGKGSSSAINREKLSLDVS